MFILNLETKITASDGATKDGFGEQLSLNGNILVVGSFLDDDNGDRSGSVYIFERVNRTWKEISKLTPSDGAAGDFFGDTIKINGNTALIGSWGDDDNGDFSGSVYIFEKVDGVWKETTKLTPSDGAPEDLFGISFDQNGTDGNVIMVGNWKDDDNSSDSGSVYILKKVAGVWTEQEKIYASDGAKEDEFGRFIDINDTKAIIGALNGDGNEKNSGAAYIFEEVDEKWKETAKLTPSDGEEGDLFGRVVKINDKTAIVGSPRNNNKQGAAYIFEEVDGEWKETAKLTASDGADGDGFGASVALKDDILVVASRYDDDNGEDSGSVYVYEKIDGNWTEIEKIVAPDGEAGDVFGKRLDINGNNLVVGSFLDDDNLVNSGSVYLYKFDRAGNRFQNARDFGVLDPLSPPQTFSDWVGLEDQRDFFRFELKESTSNFELTLDGLNDNANVFLVNLEQKFFASSRNERNTSEVISANLDPGVYHILVRSDYEDGNPATDYQLTLSF